MGFKRFNIAHPKTHSNKYGQTKPQTILVKEGRINKVTHVQVDVLIEAVIQPGYDLEFGWFYGILSQKEL